MTTEGAPTAGGGKPMDTGTRTGTTNLVWYYDPTGTADFQMIA